MKFQIPGVKNIGVIEQTHFSQEKDATTPELSERPSEDSENIDDTTPVGVKRIEAATQVWTQRALIITYLSIFIIYFVNSFQQQVSSNLLAYVTSDFGQHALLSTTGVVSNIVGGVIKLPLARLLDVVGRSQGFAFMVFVTTIGIIMMAACNNITTYAAAQVFYWVGFDGMGYVLGVIIADTSSLRNRGLMYAFVSSPYIATTWAGPSAAESFLKGAGWRWGYGTFAIVTPIMCMPFLLIYFYNIQKAHKVGVRQTPEQKRTFLQAACYWFIEFDVFGMVLVVTGFSIFLLPFSLATYQANKWRSPSIICMLVFGVVILVGWVIYEARFSPKPFIPFKFLHDRTVAGSCLLACVLFVAFYCWDSYFLSYLQVVHNLSVQDAGYVGNIYSIGSCFWALVVGYAIRRTNRFKWVALAFVPLNILGTGLMIHFRRPEQGIGYVIMCQIFIAFAGGALVIAEEIAIMAPVAHENVASALALQYLASSVGGAIGLSVSGAIWTNTLPEKLEKYLPANLKSQALTIYGDLVTQLSYPVGSPARDAIIRAYGDTQKLMCIAATAVLSLSIVAVVIWKDINLKERKQVKGLVV